MKEKQESNRFLTYGDMGTLINDADSIFECKFDFCCEPALARWIKDNADNAGSSNEELIRAVLRQFKHGNQ